MRQKGFTPIIILLVIAVLAVAGYFAYSKGYLNQLIGKNVTPYITPAPYPINTKPPETPDPTANWKTYINTQYGFSIKYPEEFFHKEIQETPGQQVIFGVQMAEKTYQGKDYNYPYIFVTVIRTAMTPEQFIEQNGTSISVMNPNNKDTKNYLYYGITNKKDVTAGGLNARRFDSENVSTGTTHTMIKNGDYIFDVGNQITGVGEISAADYDQIISTFKFTQQ